MTLTLIASCEQEHYTRRFIWVDQCQRLRPRDANTFCSALNTSLHRVRLSFSDNDVSLFRSFTAASYTASIDCIIDCCKCKWLTDERFDNRRVPVTCRCHDRVRDAGDRAAYSIIRFNVTSVDHQPGPHTAPRLLLGIAGRTMHLNNGRHKQVQRLP